ncbi:MAG TPA: hypothetical protein VGB77_22310 [Abditibacteriaceae bacterium]
MGIPDFTLILPDVPIYQLTPLLLIVSFVMPYLIALVQQRAWSDAVRSRVTFGVCSLVAALILKMFGRFDLADVPSTTIALFGLTVTIYRHFAKANGASALEDFSTQVLAAGRQAVGQKPNDETHDEANDEDFS